MITVDIEYRTRLALAWARLACRLHRVIGAGRAYELAMWGVRRWAKFRIGSRGGWRSFGECQGAGAKP